ncbi:MAG: hypothetical protein HGA35_06615 [Erysipelotrichaceae bacterium]|nr:hypothetical protein [Erysipelotrichaceae bacterium]
MDNDEYARILTKLIYEDSTTRKLREEVELLRLSVEKIKLTEELKLITITNEKK